MPTKKETIEIHKDELSTPGIDIATFDNLQEYLNTAHRDDHYMFVILQNGNFLWELDFKEITRLVHL